jgi:hypothetical protein
LICAALRPESPENVANDCWPSSTRATSFSRTSDALSGGAAPGAAAASAVRLFRMMFSNCETSERRPSVNTVNWKI